MHLPRFSKLIISYLSMRALVFWIAETIFAEKSRFWCELCSSTKEADQIFGLAGVIFTAAPLGRFVAEGAFLLAAVSTHGNFSFYDILFFSNFSIFLFEN